MCLSRLSSPLWRCPSYKLIKESKWFQFDILLQDTEDIFTCIFATMSMFSLSPSCPCCYSGGRYIKTIPLQIWYLGLPFLQLKFSMLLFPLGRDSYYFHWLLLIAVSHSLSQAHHSDKFELEYINYTGILCKMFYIWVGHFVWIENFFIKVG